MANNDLSGKLICSNKMARLNYFIDDTFEAGIVLSGTEVKALREGRANLGDSYAQVTDGEVFLYDLHISPYTFGNRFNHEPLRIRKLLLHKQQIKRLYGKTQEKGFSLIPLKLYFKSGRVKVELGLGRGKKLYDKREALRKREDERDMARNFRQRDRD